MRTKTAAQQAATSALDGYATWTRVRVLIGATWYDLTNLEGADFLKGVTWGTNQDTPSAAAEVDVAYDADGFTIAPLRGDSQFLNIGGDSRPLMDEARTFVVECALMPAGVTPTSTDWTEFFRGNIDRNDTAGRTGFRGQDMLSQAQDVLLESEATYGSEAGVAVETVMGQLLTAGGLSSLPLYVDGTPGFLVGPYKQKRTQVAEALFALADQIGWWVRCKWVEGLGWRLVLEEPFRTQDYADWEYTPDQYVELSRCETSIEQVRNRWVGVYQSKTEKDAAGHPLRVEVVVEDEDSIARYSPVQGEDLPRACFVQEDAASNIDTTAEMERMLEAGLADFKDVSMEVEVLVPFNPFLDVNDMVGLLGPTQHFDADQLLAVAAVEHKVGGGRSETRLTLRGKPSTSRARWYKRLGQGPHAPILTAPLQPTVTATTPTVNGFEVTVAPAVYGPATTAYELHLSPTSGFTPDASNPSTTLKATGSTQKLALSSLTPGVTYYGRVVPRDAKGNRGDPSTEFSVVTRYVAPADAQPYTAWGLFPPNPDFEAQTNASAPPDKWAMTTGTWGTHAELVADSYTGGKSLKLTGTGNAVLESELFLVREGETWGLDFFLKSTSTGVALVDVEVRWYSAVGVVVSTVGFTGWAVAASGAWEHASGVFIAPATAKYAAVRLSGTYGQAVWIDSARATPSDVPTETTLSVTSYGAGWSAYGGGFDGAAYYVDGMKRVHLSGVVKSGAAGTAIFTLPGGYRPSSQRIFVVYTDAGTFGRVDVYANGNVVFVLGNNASVSLDGISFRAA